MDSISDYWHTNRALAAKHGLVWDLPVSDVGQVSKSDAWNLKALAGAVPPPRIQLRNFGFDTKALQYINTQRRELHEPLVEQRALSASWQDVIKAAAIHAIVINRNTPAHVAQNIARPLRLIATCNRQTEPWALQFDHVQEALDVAAALQPSGLLKGTTEAVVRYVIDYNHLSDSSPLLPAKGAHERRSSGGPATLKRPLTTNGLRKRLVDRRVTNCLGAGRPCSSR